MEILSTLRVFARSWKIRAWKIRRVRSEQGRTYASLVMGNLNEMGFSNDTE